MRKKAFSPYCGAATLALAAALSASPASAGFQWGEREDVGAVQSTTPYVSASPPPVSTAASSAPTNRPEYISPLIITGGETRPMAAPTLSNSSAAPAAVVPSPISAAPAAAPIATGDAGLTTFSVSPAPAPASAAKRDTRIDLANETISLGSPPPVAPSEIVKGFASQVPLGLALRQVLPSQYNFAVDQGVDVETLVSYKGGKPWNETLKAMLVPAGLDYHQQGNLITVGKQASAVAAPAPVLAAIAAPAPVPTPMLQPLPAPASAIIPQKMEFLAPSAEKPVAVPRLEGWTAERGDTLHKVLANWCARAGVELKWLAEYDYPVEGSAHFNGSFEEAVRSLIAGFETAKPQPIGELHINQRAGQNVLVVHVRGNSYTN
jgi:hypothetical protein